MSTVKTAISIRESLMAEVDGLAREMNVPRSRVFVMAVEEYLLQHRNQQLLAQINQAYADETEPAERDLVSRMKGAHRRLVEGQW
jgi:metal-responsive CopG/Arc/MetJ family transcriptional regulator